MARHIQLIVGRTVVEVCFDHATVLARSLIGRTLVRVGRPVSSACELCRTAEGAALDDLTSGDPDRLHVLHESLGYEPTDSDEQALRDIAEDFAARLAIVQLAALKPEDL